MRLAPALLLALSLTLTGCSATGDAFEADGSCDGVQVVVNFSGEAENLSRCVRVDDGGEVAKQILAAAGISIEGTKAYGDQVICRVNEVPSATEALNVAGEDPYLETCEDMPAAFAYWGLWVRSSDSSEWEYAMEGISSLQMTTGESLGLAFSIGGEAPTPSD